MPLAAVIMIHGCLIVLVKVSLCDLVASDNIFNTTDLGLMYMVVNLDGIVFHKSIGCIF